jgi:hypothetical protein
MGRRYVLSEYVEQAMAEAYTTSSKTAATPVIFRLARVWLLLVAGCASVRVNWSPPLKTGFCLACGWRIPFPCWRHRLE